MMSIIILKEHFSQKDILADSLRVHLEAAEMIFKKLNDWSNWPSQSFMNRLTFCARGPVCAAELHFSRLCDCGRAPLALFGFPGLS